MSITTSRRAFLTAGALAPEPKVEYRVLGNTGLKISALSFGCMVTSDASVVQRAADLGINFFDTARVYQNGNNERMVGAALKSRRQKVYIATKTVATDGAAALKDLETSLRTLGTDYVDVWYLHDKKSPADIKPDLIEAQQTAKKQGKIRFAGLSTHAGHSTVIPATIKTGKIDVLLTTYNFAMDRSLEPLIQSARQAGVGVVAMKVIAGSFRLDDSYDRAKAVLGRPGAARAALKWVLKNKYIDTAIPSMTDMDQLDDNMMAMAEPFNDADTKVLSAYIHRFGPLYCRMCGGCEGKCSKGLPVADVLRFLTYAEGYGQFQLGREHFLDLSRETRDVRCTCDVCTVECPNGVKVAERLRRAQELFA